MINTHGHIHTDKKGGIRIRFRGDRDSMYTSVTLKEYLEGVLLEIPGYETQKKVRSNDRTFCGDSRSRTDDPLLAKQVL